MRMIPRLPARLARAPGALTDDFSSLPYRKVHRPKWGI